MKSIPFKSVLFLVCTAVCLASTAAQTVRFTSDPRIPDEASLKDVMEPELFARTALIASGADDEQIPSLLDKLDAVYAQVALQVSPDAGTGKKAEQSLYALYTTVLSAYSLLQTRLDTALTAGTYNCVSSAILFMYIMKREGIPVAAVETPVHAFCVIRDDTGRLVDVETTNPWGYNPGTKKELAGGSLSAKKYLTVPAANYANRHTVDDRRIISLIYYNRIADLQKEKKDYETVGLAMDALDLQDYTRYALTSFHQAVYNTAAGYTAAGRDEDGLALIEEAKKVQGDSPLYQEYAAAALGNLANAAMKKSDYDGALAVLAEYKDSVSQKQYEAMVLTVTFNGLNYTVNTKPFAESLAAVRNKKSVLPSEKYLELTAYAYSKEADRIAKTGAWLAAAQLLDKGIEEVPRDSALADQRRAYRQNYGIEVHNRAVSLYNSGDHAGARALIEEGLKKVPDSTALKNDLQRLQQE